jgi:hypothetical protein
VRSGSIRPPAARNLIAARPETIRIEALAAPDVERIQHTLSMVAAESARPRPGGEAVITRLADLLVIQAIRAWIGSDPNARTGWIGALRDPQIGRALAAIHANPARPWTVAELAREVAMSRSEMAATRAQCPLTPAEIRYVAPCTTAHPCRCGAHMQGNECAPHSARNEATG